MMDHKEGYHSIDEWKQKVLIPILKSQSPKKELVRHCGGLALLSADTDKIKEYVFESAKLPEIRGASMILDDLNQAWPRERDYQLFDPRPPSNLREIFLHHGLPTRRYEDDPQDDCIIYVGGGSLLALVPLTMAEILISEIETLYPQKTGAATISCALQEIEVSDSKHIDFRDIMAHQSLLLRRAKEEKDSLPFFEAIPFARRCESCQIRPAVRQDAPDGRWLCQPCHLKAKFSREVGKQMWIKEFVKNVLGSDNKVNPVNYESKKLMLDLARGAKDLNEIALASRDERSIGFIYADGNKIGDLLEESNTIEEYRRKSEALHGAMRSAVFKSLDNHLKFANVSNKKSDNKVLPFEIITIGGDDALLIVPGDCALDISLSIGKIFEAMLADHKEFGRQVTISLGLVVADCHNPVYFLRKLADDLLRSAKKRNREMNLEDRSHTYGTMDFIVLKSQTMLSTDLSDLRTHFWTITSESSPREKSILTKRPYTWDEIEKLICTARAIHRSLPSTQLQSLCKSLRDGRLASTEFYLYQWARADDMRRNLLKWVERKWSMESNISPWIKIEPKGGYDRYSTIWEDIRELRDLLPPLDDEEWQELMQQIDDKTGGVPIHAS